MPHDKKLSFLSLWPWGPPGLEPKKTQQGGAKLFVVVSQGLIALEQK